MEHSLRSGLVLSAAQFEQLEQYLSHMQAQIPASLLLLSDVSGQVVAVRGQEKTGNLVALASLVAGDLAASQEIARLTNQYQRSQMILREGQNSHTIICEAGAYLVLLAQISRETPLGWARMVIRQGAQRLQELSTPAPTNGDRPPGLPDLNLLGEDENLSTLFDAALDDVWMD